MIYELKSNGFESINQNEMYNIEGGLISPPAWTHSRDTAAWVVAGAMGGASSGLVGVVTGACGGYAGAVISGASKPAPVKTSISRIPIL